MTPRYVRPRKASSVRQSEELERFLSKCKNDNLRCKCRRTESDLAQDIMIGDKILKDRKGYRFYVKKYGVQNLYVCRIGPDWRMIYTLVFDGAGVAVICLEVMDHKKYDQLFGYKTT